MPALVAGCDVFAFLSTKEGFGLAAMEALAAGVAVVTREFPVLREVFGAAVRYGHDADSFARALTAAPDPGRRQTSLVLSARHTWRAAAKAHIAFYRSVSPAITTG